MPLDAPSWSIAPAILLALYWTHVIREAVLYQRRSNEFRRRSTDPAGDLPLVTVVVPAKDEEAAIANCLSSLEAQTHSRLEIVAVDDRSKDRTGAIMDALAARPDSRLRVIHVKELPTGWLGKNHANELGAEAASSESQYILFTDGDVIFEPATIAAAVAHCERNGIDHFVLSPYMIPNGVWLATVQLVFGMSFVSFLSPSRLGKSKNVYVGIGAFNMVRKSTYEACDRHERLKLEVIDDGMLGKILVRNGARADIVNGKHLIRLAWYHSLWGFVTGLEKNGFAALRYSILKLIAFLVIYLLIYVLPYVMVVTTTGATRAAYLGLVFVFHVCFAIGAKMLSMSPFLSFLAPFGAIVIMFTFLRSTAITLWRGRISWRETSYSLRDLKREMVP
jgi:glycosyltransferase involved in cell wall biosynthesis